MSSAFKIGSSFFPMRTIFGSSPVPRLTSSISSASGAKVPFVFFALSCKNRVLGIRFGLNSLGESCLRVQTAETDSVTSKVTVTGTMDAQRLVDYVYSQTKKQARIVPQPEPEPEPKTEPEAEEKTEEGEKPAEEAPKAEENAEKKDEEKPPEEEKKGEENGEKKEEKVEEGKEESSVKVEQLNHFEDRNNAHMMHYYPYAYPSMYRIERVPAPQIFSDENPNACCVS
ncbi:Heavy metal-associated isoprenylated plant protein 9 [Ranunculus cassubicifolius]